MASEFLETLGGPLVLMSEAHRAEWGGMETLKRLDEDFENDYDLACTLCEADFRLHHRKGVAFLSIFSETTSFDFRANREHNLVIAPALLVESGASLIDLVDESKVEIRKRVSLELEMFPMVGFDSLKEGAFVEQKELFFIPSQFSSTPEITEYMIYMEDLKFLFWQIG